LFSELGPMVAPRAQIFLEAAVNGRIKRLPAQRLRLVILV
jgi:hypothetical protein